MIRELLSYTPELPAPLKSEGSRIGYSTDKIIPEDKVDFRNLKDLKLLYILYRRDPLCWRVVKSRAAMATARGFKIIPQSPEAGKAIKEFLFKIHKTDPINALLVGLRQLSEDAVWSGQGWWERQYSKKWDENDDPFEVPNNEITGFKKIHPLTLDFKRSATGDVLLDEEGKFGNKNEFLAYSQTFTLKNQWQKRDIDKRRIAHLTFNSIGDEPWGVSELEPIYKTRHRGLSIEDGIAQGAFRHGVPFLDVTVGDDAHVPDKEMLDNARDEVKGSSYMSELVHPPWYKVNMFEQFSLARSRGMLEPYIDLVCASTGMPKSVLMGTGEGTNKATVRELVNLLQPLIISPMQQSLKLFLEDQVFAPLMRLEDIEGLPLIQWNELFPTDYSLADKLLVLSQIILENKPLLSWTEAREIAKLPSEEEGTFYTLSRQMLSANQRGIYLTEPHGRLIHEGLKDSIITEKNYPSMINIPLILVSGKQAYGIIKLRKPKQINLDEFDKFQSSHRISDDERERWWPDSKTLWLWDFDIVEMYKFTKKVNVPQGVQKFISNVEFLSEEQLSINIKEGFRIDTTTTERKPKR